MTMAAGPGSTDADNGVTMTARDRFRHTADSAEPGSAPQAPPAVPEAAGPDSARAAGAQQPPGLEVYGDSSYGSGQARAAYRDAGHDTVIKPGPLRPAVPGGFTVDDFTIYEQAGDLLPCALCRGSADTRSPRATEVLLTWENGPCAAHEQYL